MVILCWKWIGKKEEMNDKRAIRIKIRNVRNMVELCNAVESNWRKSAEIHAVNHSNIFYNLELVANHFVLSIFPDGFRHATHVPSH